jgi:hypothetical protein
MESEYGDYTPITVNSKTTDPRAALREKAARAIAAAGIQDEGCIGQADAAISVVLEAAAAICDAYAEKDWARGEGFRNRAGLDLAAAIRGLISYTQDAKRG